MSTHKNIERVCVAATIFAIIVTLVLMNAGAFGIRQAEKKMGYENRLFDDSVVHTIDIQMDDWDSFIETCTNEEYTVCKVVIDGDSYANVGIRAKGNTSLSSVAAMDSDRYSFKIEFDHYDESISYHGLDKLSLNNLIQDNTMMKDYLTYKMMGEFGVAAPLCSYTYITVNGEEWGLYLAVEGVEESFLERNYGYDYGELYKPDSTSMGGGRGNGEKFDMDQLENMEDIPNQEFSPNDFQDGEFNPEDFQTGEFSPEDFTEKNPDSKQADKRGMNAEIKGEMNGEIPGGMNGGMNGGGMGSSDVKLQYIDDDATSYSNIFDNAKTNVSEKDQYRLIASLKSLSENEDIASVVDVESVIRYFVVHNFVCNGDSYTGSMVHNYYLYEDDGQMSMIPWDYNLAFGGFQSSSATSTVNEPIDTPVSGGSTEDRPMINWIFQSDEYTEMYHQYFAEFFETTDFSTLISQTAELIAPYVEKDPSKFCTYEEFELGVETLEEFCLLREESIQGQLDGTIPSTTDGQNTDSSSLIDASHIDISDMGSMGNTMGDLGGQEMTMPGNVGEERDDEVMPTMPEGGMEDGTMPTMPEGGMEDGTMPTMPEGGMGDGTMPTMPEGGMGNGTMPTMPEGGMGNGTMPTMPGNGEIQQMPQGQN